MGAIFNRGGIVPESYGLSLTVYPKTDVTEGQPLVFDKSVGDYGVSVAGEGVIPQAIVKVGGKTGDPISCYAIGFSRNVKVATDGAVVVGDTVVPNADGIFTKETFAEGATDTTPKGFLVVKGNPDNTAEVLI